MASRKERKKESDSGNKHLEKKNMRRGKPHQQIYRPGSGPLRKSGAGVDETESDTNIVLSTRSNNTKYQTSSQSAIKHRSEGSSPRDQITDINDTVTKLGDMNLSRDGQKKNKKPEQQLYVPRPLQSRESESKNSRVEIDHSHMNGNSNQNYRDNNERLKRPKRYTNKRRPSDASDIQEEWRSASPSFQQQNRNMRQGSEPRGVSNGSNWNRTRDTRSVEPTIIPNRNFNEKIHSKPPSGRRHSTIGLETEKRQKMPNLDQLPPRLRKKYLEDKKLNYNRGHIDDTWDGNSITFQGSNTGHPPENMQRNFIHKQNYQHVPNYATMPPGGYIHNQHVPHNDMIYYSLPRGRGRLHHEYDASSVGASTMYRSMTPEKIIYSPCNSRPPTPPSHFMNKIRSNENLHQYNSRPHTPINIQRIDESHSNSSSYDERHKDVTNRDDKNREKTPKSGFRDSLEAQLSPVSPPTPEEKSKQNYSSANSQILDWSEEVEMNDQLEAEALSDALTRSSSIASLMESSTKSLPPSTTTAKQPHKNKNRKKSKRRNSSAGRDRSVDNSNKSYSRESNQTHQNSYNNLENKDCFKIPEPRGRRRRNSRDSRDRSFDRHKNKSRNASRESSFDRNRRSSISEHENWREEIRSRQNSEMESRSRNNSERGEIDSKDIDVKKGGIIVLPQNQPEPRRPPVLNIHTERHNYMEGSRKSSNQGQQQKSLFDPNNPSKPIIVRTPSTRVNIPGFSENGEVVPPQLYTTDQFGNIRPAWYDEESEGWKMCHYPDLLRQIKQADNELQLILSSRQFFPRWNIVEKLRNFLMESLEFLLCKDLKFCQAENVEQHFWKILFHNIIELMRKEISCNLDNKEGYKNFVLWLIDDGTKYFERLLEQLEQTYKFKLNNFLGNSNLTPQKGLGFIGLALVSAQKIFLFLGDLGRYREQVNETTSYGKCRQWYIKAHEINPKNGRPYNQLAVLAVYARRKLDAVYYYMRSLMSSNPVPSARECLISLFDENRKKYEQSEKKRREERLEKQRLHMKEKESESANTPTSLRKEIWIRPDGGRRIHRTTSAIQELKNVDSEEEDLAALNSVEVNKRFVTSYLHVHGKLITKIGMESFQEAALQMLKEFRALLQHSPVPLPCNRFLQLLALNMFAIESTQLKDPQFQSQSGYRSEFQERALVVSLQMFNLILERCVSLLQEHINNTTGNINDLPPDALVLLPPVKIWCDWMLCHSSVWNPPPSTQDYRVGPAGDAWSRLASLMNLLEKLDQSATSSFIAEQREGYELIRLPEDSVLSGFTPLMYNVQDPTYVPNDFDVETGQFTLRLTKLLFFGTVFLCGLEPPVLKLEYDNDFREYISVVCTNSSRDSPPSPPELNDENDLLVESFSEDEGIEEEENTLAENASSEIRDLLTRKVELEKCQRNQELHRQRVKKILMQSVVSVHIEVRPKYLIPDTNCFIDYLVMIKTIAAVHVYTLMVPLVVLNELEGLARGGKTPAPAARNALNPEHVVKVAESAKHALEFLANRNQSVKCITTKGTILTSMTFTVEDDSTLDANLRNDDKILATCLTLCKGMKDQQSEEPRKLYRDVVLLTKDRNLRVKAIARDVPVRELPDFLQWAGLG